MFWNFLFLTLILHNAAGQLNYYNNYYGNNYNTGFNTPCAMPQRLYNPGACIQFMRQAVSDPNRFWFGTRFRQICDPPPTDPKNVTCSPSIPEGAAPFSYQTLGSHMFQDPNYNASSTYLNNLQYPLTVTYTSTPEMIQACNATVVSRQMVRFDANPNMQPLGDFFFKNRPQITAPTCTPTRLCTLMFFDVGHGNIHNIWVNWPNTDWSDYSNPGHPLNTQVNPYAWLVFQQSYEITNFTKQARYAPFSVNIANFMQQYGLTGPVGLTWQLVLGDLYGVNRLNSFGFGGTNLCPQFLDAQLRLERNTVMRDLALVPPSELGAWLMVRYNANGRETWLNPIYNGIIQMQDAASAPDLFLLLKIFGVTEGSDYAARTYSLMLVRRDAQNQQVVSPYIYPSPYNNPYGQQIGDGSVFLHWLRINIPAQNLNGGTEVLPYLAPNTSPDQYYFLLYRQPRQISSPNSTLTSNCPAGQERRCRFPLQNFVRTNQLTLDGMSRFRTFGYNYYRGYPN